MIKSTRLFAESWNLAIRKKPCGTILKDTYSKFNIIRNDLKYWAADPFLIDFKEKLYIFAELYSFKLRRGVIGCCEYIDGKKLKWKEIISEKYHLSYPFVFENGGEYYMLPESGKSRNLYLYCSIDFPFKWEKIKCIRSNVVYGDTTPFEIGKQKFALTYDVSDAKNGKLRLLKFDGKGDDVFLDFDAQDLRRPAGKFFMEEQCLMRPAQDCTETYGGGLVFYRCTMDDNKYSEKLLKRIIPTDLSYSKKIVVEGVHTYNATENYEIIDIKTRRFNLINFFYRFYDMVKRREK